MKRLFYLPLLILAAVVLVPAASSAQVIEKLRQPGVAEGLPFSTAVRVGNMVYLSGQIGTVPGTNQLIEGGIIPETRQTFENIVSALEFAGSSLERVIKCTVFLADIGEYSQMNGIYATFFATDPPARSTVAGSGLALGARVEIECVALVNNESP